jgi:hypothetical protein
MGVPALQPGHKLLSLSAVVYAEGDTLGKLLAAATLLPLALLVGYLTCVGLRRDLHTGCILLGQLLNELANALLKGVIREPRPPGAPKLDFGMPSSHAQVRAAAAKSYGTRARAYVHERSTAGGEPHTAAVARVAEASCWLGREAARGAAVHGVLRRVLRALRPRPPPHPRRHAQVARLARRPAAPEGTQAAWTFRGSAI